MESPGQKVLSQSMAAAAPLHNDASRADMGVS